MAKSILVVEDDSSIQFVVKEALKMEGYQVCTANNGQLALDRLKEDGMPNLILLDMRMPVMDGWEFCAQYAEAFEARAPILVMTAAADAASRATDVQADAFLGKPFELEALISTIKRVLR